MRKFQFIAISATILIVAGIFGFRYYEKQTKIKELVGTRSARADRINDSTVKAFGELPIGATVFVGSTLTALWPLHESFQGGKYINRGIVGNTLTHIRKRIGDICRRQPEAIVLETGITDIYNGKDKDLIFAEILDIVDTILRVSPETTIYLQSILPVVGKADSAYYNPIIRGINNNVAGFVIFANDTKSKPPPYPSNMNNLRYVHVYSALSVEMRASDILPTQQGYRYLSINYKQFFK